RSAWVAVGLVRVARRQGLRRGRGARLDSPLARVGAQAKRSPSPPRHTRKAGRFRMNATTAIPNDLTFLRGSRYRLTVSIAMALFLTAFLLLFQPFGVNNYDPKHSYSLQFVAI